MTAGEIVALAALLAWLGLSLDRSRAWPSKQVLPDPRPSDVPQVVARVVAVVPARNEADILVETLPTLLCQQGTLDRILLVDDGSDDGTAQAAADLARESQNGPPLEVLRTSIRPPGWTGKVHAQNFAYEHLVRQIEGGRLEPPDWLLLTDADIRHRCDSVAALLRRASDGGGYGMVSVMARLQAKSFWERLLIPAFVFFFQVLYPFTRVADPDSAVAAAAGGCILIRWREVVSIGGFSAIGGQIIDDVALGKAVKAGGSSIWLGLDPEIVSIRPYRGLGDLWQMVSRTAFTQLGYSWLWLVLTLAALVTLVASPPVLLGWAGLHLVAEGADAGSSVVRTILWAALAWGLMSLAILPSIRHHRVPAGYATTLPFGAVLFGLMTATSAWNYKIGRGAVWRGRRYGGAE